SAFRMPELLKQIGPSEQIAHVGPDRRELNAFGLHLRAIDLRSADQRPVPAPAELDRDRQIRMQIAKGPEGVEDDARHAEELRLERAARESHGFAALSDALLSCIHERNHFKRDVIRYRRRFSLHECDDLPDQRNIAERNVRPGIQLIALQKHDPAVFPVRALEMNGSKPAIAPATGYHI